MDDLFNLGFCLFLLIFYNCSLVSGSTKSEGLIVTQSDYQSLQALKHDLIDPRGVLKSWNNNSACSGWAGIKCVNGHVIAIQLPWKGLSGRISENIGQLRSLRRIGLHDNLLVGPVPASLGLLPNLRGVYLFNNRLSGSIPPSIGDCLFLQTLDLSNNRLTGFIPPGLANSTRLYRLNLGFNGFSGPIPDSLSRSASLTFLALQNNNLTGSVPDNWGGLSVNGSYRLSSIDLSRNNLTGEIPISLVNLKNLSSFNVSYNNLSGPVPSGLAEKFNSTSFVGNVQLCGYTGSGRCHKNINLTSPSQGEIKNHRRRKLSTRDIIVIAAVSLLIVLLILLCCVFLCFLIRKKSASKTKKGKTVNSAPVAAPSGEADSGGGGGGKLVHFDGNFVFTADDLLCATAETMGKSAYGTAYKTTLEDINRTVAVKRLREKITKVQTEFELEVSALGKIRHANIVALRAYYLGPKGEKLLVYDYLPNGSLASFLHARGPETSIPWHTRMSIATGITRGLSFLHAEQNKIVHGNLTSSNILLDEHNNPQIAHAGLARLMTSASAGTNPIATAGTMGYRAPELSKQKNAAAASAKADVFSLGVIILELLTGKSPSEMKDGLDLAQWAALTVKDGRSDELFDVETTRGAESNGEGDELINTLKLALHCVDPSAAARPEARQVLQTLEEMKARDVSTLPATEDV